MDLVNILKNYSPRQLQQSFNFSYQFKRNHFLDFVFYLHDKNIPETDLGSALLRVFPEAKKLVWDSFYPLKNNHRLERELLPKNIPPLYLGTLAHSSIIKELSDFFSFSSYDVVHTSCFLSLSSARANQLKKMSINPRKKYLFDIYKNKSLNYASTKGFVF